MKTITRSPARYLAVLLLHATSMTCVGTANAAPVYFLQIDTIKGESTDVRHRDWIDVSSFSWGIHSSTSIGTGGGRVAGKAEFSPLAWTQLLDMSVPPMFVGVASGQHYRNATLDVLQPGGTTREAFFRMEFDDVILTALDIGGTGGIPGVSGALQYSKVTMTYRPQKADGTLDAPVIGGWDLRQNTAAAFFGSPQVLQGLALAGPTSTVPVPASAWLFGTGLAGLIGTGRRRRTR